MSQVDYLNFFINTFWFLLLFVIIYYYIFTYFIPYIYIGLHLRRLLYLKYLKNNLNIIIKIYYIFQDWNNIIYFKNKVVYFNFNLLFIINFFFLKLKKKINNK